MENLTVPNFTDSTNAILNTVNDYINNFINAGLFFIGLILAFWFAIFFIKNLLNFLGHVLR